MNSINVEELKKIQIDMLKSIDIFCKKNDIKYWIDFGTLLGAVRHEGFIPWDDDIDISMLRDDYDKFVRLFNKENGKYIVKDFSLDRNWHCAYGKILNINTTMYEPDEKTGIESSVFIDVFIYDNVPDDDKALSKIFKKRNFYRKLHNIQVYKKSYYEGNYKYRFFRYPVHLLLQLLPKRYFLKKIIKLETICKSKNTEKVGLICGQRNLVFEKKVFEKIIMLNFENNKYPAPSEYDKVLKEYYGDYMKLPPKEKQVSHHRFVAYYKKE